MCSSKVSYCRALSTFIQGHRDKLRINTVRNTVAVLNIESLGVFFSAGKNLENYWYFLASPPNNS
jgi:hypothetical protein